MKWGEEILKRGNAGFCQAHLRVEKLPKRGIASMHINRERKLRGRRCRIDVLENDTSPEWPQGRNAARRHDPAHIGSISW